MRQWIVPSCRECNSALSGQLFPTLRERRAAAHDHIRRKYAAYLRVPNWGEEELLTMGPKARTEIAAALKIRDWVRGRLRWAGASAAEDVMTIYTRAAE